MIVKKMADKIDEANKKVFQDTTVVEYQKQPDGTKKRVEFKKKMSLYDIHKRRREDHFKGARGGGDITIPNVIDAHRENVAQSKEAELNKKAIDLEKWEAELEKKAADMNVEPPAPPVELEEPISDEYTRDDLMAMVPVSKLKKLAKD